MANIQEITRRYTLEARTVGVDDATQKTVNLGKAHNETAKQVDGATAATTKYQAALERSQRQFDLQMRQQAQFTQALQQINAQQQQATAATTAANDNVARSMDRMASSGYTFTGILARIGLTVAATALGVGALYTAFKILYEIVTFLPNKLSEAWELGGKKLEEYRQIAEKAAAVDLSTTYFQRITKAATDAKLPVDDLTTALKLLATVSTEKLGGSDLQNRVDASVKAGNFGGNTGVGQLASANTQEEKFRAIVSLIDQAMTKGERLAALDISSKAFGPAITANLQKDSEYLTRMVASADKLAEKELVSPSDVGRALALQNSYDAAVKILEVRWHPIQDLLTAAGIKMHEVWVGIVVTIANAVDWAARLVVKLSEVQLPPQVVSWLNRASSADMENATPDSTRIPETASAADLAAIKAANDRTGAVARLTAGLQNQKAVEQAVAQVNAVQNAVWRDTSKNIDDQKKALDDTRDAYDRARDAAQKHYAQTNADSDAIGLGVGAQAEFRTKAAMTTAALIAQRDMTPTLRAEIDAYGKAARTAAEANERLRLAAQNKFERATIGLSPEDVQIATQLKGLYPDVTTALNSTEAAQMRVNNQLRLGNEIVTGFSNDLVSGLLRGENGMKSLESAATNLIAKLASKNLTNFMSPGGSIFGNQSLNSAQGAVGVASAGLAGYQSGNPLTGALGGAMAGATFGPWGAAIGGAAGLIGGLLGKDSQAAKALQEAQQRWHDMAGQMTAFSLAAKGTSAPLINALGKRPVANDNEKEKSHDRDERNKAA